MPENAESDAGASAVFSGEVARRLSAPDPVSNPGPLQRVVGPGEILGERAAAPSLIGQMPMTKGQETNRGDGVQQPYAVAVDLNPGRRLVGCERTLQHRL